MSAKPGAHMSLAAETLPRRGAEIRLPTEAETMPEGVKQVAKALPEVCMSNRIG